MGRAVFGVALALAGTPAAARGQQCALPPHPYFAFQVTVPAQWIPDSTVTPRSDGAARGASPQALPALVQFR